MYKLRASTFGFTNVVSELCCAVESEGTEHSKFPS